MLSENKSACVVNQMQGLFIGFFIYIYEYFIGFLGLFPIMRIVLILWGELFPYFTIAANDLNHKKRAAYQKITNRG
jgi:hypothetical protein